MKRNFVALLGVSLLLHLGVVAWLLSRPRPSASGGARPIELDLIQVNLSAVPVPEPQPPEPARPPPQRRNEAAAVEPTHTQGSPPLAVSAAPTSTPTKDDVPRAQAAPLVPILSLTWALDAGVQPEEQGGGLHAPAVSGDLVGALARETIGHDKVDRGLVHPYYSQLGKALMKNWDADRAVSSAGLKGFVEQMAENSKTWNSIWQERASVFGKSGTPFDAPASGRAKPPSDRLIPGQDLAARREVAKVMSEQMRSTRRAQIRVTQDAAGKLTQVELLKPSNDSNVDRQAIADVRAAAERLPPPPDEALGGRTGLVSIWEFELVVSITPPIPTFTFEFDEVIGFVDARLPLDRRIYKKVRLVAIE